jgi:hypothetical protein
MAYLAESRMLATVGAFRVVSQSDVLDRRDGDRDTGSGLRHLEHEGLVRLAPLNPSDRATATAAGSRGRRDRAMGARAPHFDEHVHFPDVRIGYEDRDGQIGLQVVSRWRRAGGDILETGRISEGKING